MTSDLDAIMQLHRQVDAIDRSADLLHALAICEEDSQRKREFTRARRTLVNVVRPNRIGQLSALGVDAR